MLGIIGAMESEVARLKEIIENAKVANIAGMSFYCGKLKGKDAVVVRSGIGKVNAAMCSQILVDCYHVDAIINTGVAGSLKSEIDIGDIVLSTDALQHDMDATVFGYALGQIPQTDAAAFPANEKLLALGMRCCHEANPDIRVFAGRIVSGDQFICSREKKQWLVETFGGYCTEMEGAAIAQAAYLNHVPFLIVRAVSDKSDDSATMSYDQFEIKAADHSVRFLEAMIGAME